MNSNNEPINNEIEDQEVKIYNQYHNLQFNKKQIERTRYLTDKYNVKTSIAIKYLHQCHFCGDLLEINKCHMENKCIECDYEFCCLKHSDEFDLKKENGEIFCYWGKKCELCNKDYGDDYGDDYNSDDYIDNDYYNDNNDNNDNNEVGENLITTEDAAINDDIWTENVFSPLRRNDSIFITCNEVGENLITTEDAAIDDDIWTENNDEFTPLRRTNSIFITGDKYPALILEEPKELKSYREEILHCIEFTKNNELFDDGFYNVETGVTHNGCWKIDEKGIQHFYPDMNDESNKKYFGKDATKSYEIIEQLKAENSRLKKEILAYSSMM